MTDLRKAAAGRTGPRRTMYIAAAVLAIGAALPAWAGSGEAASTQLGKVAPAGQAPGTPVTVEGFRSARFGIDEAGVRAAIEKDFGLKGKAIKKSVNPVERTTILAVLVPELIPGGGTARVAYVLGYKSHKLIQVGVSWSAGSDPAITPKMLFDNGELLKAHFLAAGYQPDTVRHDVALKNGLLLFRGAGAKKHATILLLQGRYGKAAAGGRRLLTPTGLDLLYAADPDHPDIFRLAKGSF